MKNKFQCHFKNPCDGLFGELQNILCSVSMRQVVATEHDIVAVYKEAAAANQILNPLRPKQNFYLWMPPPKHTIKLTPIDPASLPAKITTC